MDISAEGDRAEDELGAAPGPEPEHHRADAEHAEAVDLHAGGDRAEIVAELVNDD